MPNFSDRKQSKGLSRGERLNIIDVKLGTNIQVAYRASLANDKAALSKWLYRMLLSCYVTNKTVLVF